MDPAYFASRFVALGFVVANASGWDARDRLDAIGGVDGPVPVVRVRDGVVWVTRSGCDLDFRFSTSAVACGGADFCDGESILAIVVVDAGVVCAAWRWRPRRSRFCFAFDFCSGCCCCCCCDCDCGYDCVSGSDRPTSFVQAMPAVACHRRPRFYRRTTRRRTVERRRLLPLTTRRRTVERCRLLPLTTLPVQTSAGAAPVSQLNK